MSRRLNNNTQYVASLTYCVLLFLAACSPATPAVFIPPSASNGQPTQSDSIAFSTPTSIALDLSLTPEATLAPILEQPSPTPPCTDSLNYIDDLTVPDGTIVSAGQSIDKQWRVENNGSCNWDSRYRLKLSSGDALGGPAEMALFPARAGTQTIIQVSLVAPQEVGIYRTAWQAYNPDGIPFEQPIYIEIIVQ